MVNTNTIALKFNGSTVTPSVAYAAPITTISYQVAAALTAGSLNQVVLNYQDTASNNLGVQYSFNVGTYVGLPSSAVGALGTASVPGFIYRVAQGTTTNSIDGSFALAQELLDGRLVNAATGLPFTNEATLSGSGLQPDTNGDFAGTFFVDEYESNSGAISFSSLNPPALPLRNGGSLDFTVYPFPGIPGVDSDGTSNYDNFADDVLAYVPLNAGTYTFGVAVWGNRVDTPPDNGYELLCGANPRDYFSTVVGQYVRTTIGSTFSVGANTNTFTFVAPVSGVYPFRLFHWAPAPASGGSSDAMLAWYYVDPVSGANVLINDPSGSISAYRVSTIPREPYVAEVSPAAGGQGFPSTAPIVVILSDDQLQVGSGSVKLFLNGSQVTPIISKSNALTTVTYTPNASRATITNNLQLVYSDNAAPTPNSFTNNWSFTIVVAGATVPPVTGQWDFNGNLNATVGSNLLFFDGPSGQSASLMTFGTCSSFGIPLINGLDTQVLSVPQISTNEAIDTDYGLAMYPLIPPNGGGLKVNQYTIIYDMYYSGGTLPFFQCQNTNNANGTDGSLFLQGGAMGQGSGGYNMNHGNVGTGWHRLALAVDLSKNLITKWVDGVKADDWVSSANGLDAARRAWQPEVSLFSDCDGDDHNASIYVSSIQVRGGKVSDADMVLLGGPSAGKIPQSIPATSVTGQWDFNFINAGDQLTASVGSNLLYFDGPSGVSSQLISFDTCTNYGIPLINGVNAQVMEVPQISTNESIDTDYGLAMYPLIAPNGGGKLVNQYTIIYDMYYSGGTLPFFQCQNTNNANGTDGSLFLQGGAMGQGSGGYNMNHGNVGTGWHRLALAVDLSKNLITKWVDGVKADDWVSSANGLDAARRAWQPEVSLFSDCDGDDHNATVYVKSIQVSSGKLSDAQMMALGGPSAYGIPLAVPALNVALSGGNVVFSWDTAFDGFVLNSTTDLANPSWTPVSGVDYTHNTYAIPAGSGGAAVYFQLAGNTNLVSSGLGNEPGLP